MHEHQIKSKEPGKIFRALFCVKRSNMDIKVFLIAISCCSLRAMEISDIKGPVVLSVVPSSSMTWSAYLSDGQKVTASAIYKSRRTRHSNPDDFLRTYYKARIGKTKVTDRKAQEWLQALVRVAHSRK